MTVTLTTAGTTLPAENFDTVCDAIGLAALPREIGKLRLNMAGRWDFTVGDDAYTMRTA